MSQKANIRFIEKCYQLYEQKMYQVAYSILRDERMAEDAVQEAFLKLMKSKILFKDANSDDCKRYMITVIKNASIECFITIFLHRVSFTITLPMLSVRQRICLNRQ